MFGCRGHRDAWSWNPSRRDVLGDQGRRHDACDDEEHNDGEPFERHRKSVPATIETAPTHMPARMIREP